MLTSRMKNAMSLILEAEGYITLKSIAEKLGVSNRTLLREVDSLVDWTEKNGGSFVKKKGSGVKVEGDRGEKERLLECLHEADSDVIFTPEQRSVVIRAELLKTDEPVKLYAIATILDVVESTISGDLVNVEEWFEGYELQVIRRQGLGILLKGTEKAKRKAIISLLHEQFSISEFLEFIRSEKEKYRDELHKRINKSLFGLLQMEDLKSVAEMLDIMGRSLGFGYEDNAFMALTLRFCVTIQRRDHWGEQLLAYDYREVLRKDRVYKALRQWMVEHPDSLLKEMPEEELLYLTMHMKGSKLRDTKYDAKISMVEDFRTIQLAKEFVLAVEKETGIYLSDNESLVFGLVKHLRPAIYRMKMELDFINPLLMEIKSMYPKLFLAIRKCSELIEIREQVKVPDDEIAFLATHIGAIIQKEDREIVKKFQVVLACMYGIGASQLLVASIEKNFRNIDIVNVISVIDYKMERVDFRNIDLVISTIPLDTGDTPCLVVNPVFRQEDVMEISTFIKNFTPIKGETASGRPLKFREKMLQLKDYNQTILSLIEQFEYVLVEDVANMVEMIQHASKNIAGDEAEEERLIKAFEQREEKGSTILSKKGMLLLHCRADLASTVSLKMYRMEKPIVIDHLGEAQPIRTIVVMVGPAQLDENILNILSEISRSIITSEFSETILYGSFRETELELHRILDDYFQKLTIGH